MQRHPTSSSRKRSPSRNTKKMQNIYSKNMSRPKKPTLQYYKDMKQQGNTRLSHRNRSAKTEKGLTNSILSNKVKQKQTKLGLISSNIYRKPSKSPPVNKLGSQRLGSRLKNRNSQQRTNSINKVKKDSRLYNEKNSKKQKHPRSLLNMNNQIKKGSNRILKQSERIIEPQLQKFDSFSDNKLTVKQPSDYDRKELESELFKVRNSKKRGVIQNSIQLEDYQLRFDKDQDSRGLNTDLLSNIDSFKNFESFRIDEDVKKYPNYNLPADLNEMNKQYVSERFKKDGDYELNSEKFLKQKRQSGPENKINKKIIKSVHMDSQFGRFTAGKKSRKDSNNIADNPNNFNLSFRDLQKEADGILYDSQHSFGKKEKEISSDDEYSQKFVFDSFKKNDDSKLDYVSNFSSFSNNKSVEKRPPKLGMNLLESFGNNPSEIIIELINNWGSKFQIGLSEVKFFTADLKEIYIKRNKFKLYNRNRIISTSKVNSLTNDRITSRHTNDMFLLNYTQGKSFYSLKIELPFDGTAAFLVLWNCNEDITKGVCECKIFFANQKLFHGKLPRANGKKSNCQNFHVFLLNEQADLSKITSYLNDLSTSLGFPKKSSKRAPSLRQVKNKSKKERTPSKVFGNNSKVLDKARTPTPTRNKRGGLKIDPPSERGLGQFGKAGNIFSYRNTRQTVGNEKRLHKSKIEGKWGGRPKSGNGDEILLDYIRSYQTKTIPITPLINGITCKLLSTWDNKTTVGLNGIEVFNTEGEKVEVRIDNLKISSKIGKIPSNARNNEKLINDDFNNCDEKKQWVCFVGRKFPLEIKLKFKEPQNIALIRVWNYNGSRIHAGKGVKNMLISDYSDNKLLFAGCVRKASGMINKLRKNFESILFTKNNETLLKLSKGDWLYKKSVKTNKEETKTINEKFMLFINERPTTAELMGQSISQYLSNKKSLNDKNSSPSIQRPVLHRKLSNSFLDIAGSVAIKTLKLVVLETWEESTEFSLNGLEFFTNQNRKIPEDNYKIVGKGRQIEDNTSVDKGIKARKTVLCPFRSNQENCLEVQFKQSTEISFMRLHSSFENPENIRKGIKRLNLFANGALMNSEEGFYVKRGSCLEFMARYPQQINFPITQKVFNIEPRPSAVTPVNAPTGFSIRINLLSSFGDPYYIGLNGLEIFDMAGNNLLTRERKGEFKLVAEPPGVYVLPGLSKDKRVPSNLYNGSNLSEEYPDIWLAPNVKFDKSYNGNVIIIEFLSPITLGAINFWHYTKDHYRSVKEVEIFMDGCLIYCNALNDVKERMLSSVVFNEKYLHKKIGFAEIQEIDCYPKEVTALDNEGNMLNRKQSDVFLDSMRPTTGIRYN